MKRTVTPDELATPLVAYDDAIRIVGSAFAPLPPLNVPLDDALGLVAAEDVVSPIAVPGFDSSAMDGYAVRSVDLAGAGPQTPVRLRLTGDIPAGTAPTHAVEPGTAVKIMTGGPIPPDADTIVPWEETQPLDDDVAILVEQRPGKHIRPAGEDVPAGHVAVAEGVALRPVHIGVLASIGHTHVRAYPRPRIAVLSTGEELVEPGGTLALGQVFNSNQALLGALCRAAGADVVRAGSVGDDPDAVGGWIAEAAREADLIVTSGGASVGEHDWLREVLSRDGELAMWRVALKPGKPIAFGRVAGKPVLALPGNPGSVYACAHVFVQPAIRAMAGREPRPNAIDAVLSEAVKGSPSRTLLCRVTLRGRTAEPLPAQSSVVLSNIAPADGYAIVPPGGLGEGAKVRVELID